MAAEPLPAHLTERTVAQLLRRAAAERRDVRALSASSHLDGPAELTYGELAERSAHLAALLRSRGVGPGDRVAILLDPDGTAEAHIAYHAAHLLGAINVPLNVRYVERELEWVLRFTAPAAVVLSPRFAPILSRMGDALAGAVLVECADHPALGVSLSDAWALDPVREPAPVTEHDDADWIFTSGTTGNPKAVALTHGASVACGHQAMELWGLDGDSVLQSFSPFFTSTGCHTSPLATLAAGCCSVVEEAFDVRGTLERAAREGTTSIFLISGVIQLLLDRLGADEIAAYDLGALQRICYGAQPMGAAFFPRVKAVFEDGMGLELVHLWGLTEGGTAGTFLPPSRHAEGVAKAGPHGLSIGTVGFNDWVRWRVADDEGTDCAPDEVGEICLQAPSLMDRYVDEPEATAEALRDGWLHTGDMGCTDADGFLYFVDRRKQMIRRGGLNISSAEVEGVLMAHPAVLEVAVVGRPNPVLEQEPRAVVVVREGMTADAGELIAYCREQLADFKVPVEVEFLDALPRNAMNRVVKGALTGDGSALGT